MSKEITVPIGISNRHVHVSEEDLQLLFGKGYQLKNNKNLKQVGQYAADEIVTIQGSRGSIEKVRILGPVRKATQVEISITDSFKLGVKAPVMESGNMEDTPGITIIGPKGTVELKKGVLVASRHIHMQDTMATELGFKNNDVVKVETFGKRALVFHNVLIRVHQDFRLEMHVDMDEANAAALQNDDLVKIII